MTIDTHLATLAALQARLADLHAAHGEARLAALTPAVRQRWRDLDAYYAADLDTLEAQVQARTVLVKEAVLVQGHSVQGHGLHAVYVKGRVSWDDRALQGFATGHPEVLQFRTQGAPSVSLRTTPEQEG
jgi:hypothetical protein